MPENTTVETVSFTGYVPLVNIIKLAPSFSVFLVVAVVGGGVFLGGGGGGGGCLLPRLLFSSFNFSKLLIIVILD